MMKSKKEKKKKREREIVDKGLESTANTAGIRRRRCYWAVDEMAFLGRKEIWFGILNQVRLHWPRREGKYKRKWKINGKEQSK